MSPRNEYRHGAHSVFEIHLHLVWVTKYRKPVLVGPLGHRVRDLIREICGGLDVHILKGQVSKDHVPLLVSIPPQVTISRLVQRLKGKTAYRMLDVAGVRAVAGAVLGPAPVGAGVFLLQ
jgi:putative transposase